MGTLVTALLVLVLTGALALGGFFVTDHFLPLERRRQNNDVLGFIYAVVGPLYAILLAFVVVIVWGYYEDARTAADDEAVAVQTLFELSHGFAGQDGEAIAQAALAYAQSVIRDEWPRLAHGQESPRTEAALDTLSSRVLALEPMGERQAQLYAQALSDLHDLRSAREHRTLKSRQNVQPVLWGGLLVGAGITIGFAYLFGMRDRASHAALIAVLTVSIVGILVLIQAIAAPFRGDVHVTPAAMEHALAVEQAALSSAPGGTER